MRIPFAPLPRQVLGMRMSVVPQIEIRLIIGGAELRQHGIYVKSALTSSSVGFIHGFEDTTFARRKQQTARSWDVVGRIKNAFWSPCMLYFSKRDMFWACR